MVQFTALLAGLGIIAPVFSHPGGHEPEDLQKRDALWRASKRSLADCASSLKGRALQERAAARRSEIANRMRKRGIENKPFLRARDNYDDVLARNHSAISTGITSYNTDPSLLFSGNTSCILAPEVTQGPYWVTGEHIRKDVRECQEGTDFYLDLQFIDINTCEPVTQMYVDIWHCNATGVYSGIVASGNGDSNDPSNLDATFLRGVWKTDDEGVAQFQTIFPGHYQGRSTHIHVIAHQGASENLNGTISGGEISHVGQLFFDESLRAEVEKAEPYASNTQPLTTNEEDMWAPEAAGDEFDPFVQYVYLGEKASDGLFGWISIGIDTTQTYDVSNAATLTENGGVVNNDFNLGGGGGGAGGFPSGMPSGGFPSGMPSGALPSGGVFPSGGAIPSGIPSDIPSGAAPQSSAADPVEVASSEAETASPETLTEAPSVAVPTDAAEIPSIAIPTGAGEAPTAAIPTGAPGAAPSGAPDFGGLGGLFGGGFPRGARGFRRA